MTPQERLAEAICIAGTGHYRDWSHDEAAAVMDPDHTGASAAILAAAPNLAQDIADGEALRLLRRAADDGTGSDVVISEDPDDEEHLRFMVRVEGTEFYGLGARLASAADACRAEVEARS